MLNKRFVFGVLIAAGTMVAFGGCSSSGDDNKTPTPAATTAAASSTATTVTNTATTPAATATPSPAATPTPSAADKLATTAQYFVYTGRDGDNVASVANLFNGEPGSAKAGYPDQIRELNNLTDSVAKGQEIAIPLLATPVDIIPTAGIKNGIAQASSKVALLEPGTAMLTANGGKLVLHSVEFTPDMSGYRMEYWLTDTAAFNATGALTNKDAKVTTPYMTVASGSLAKPTSADTAHDDRAGIAYSVTRLAGATSTPAELLAGLKTG